MSGTLMNQCIHNMRFASMDDGRRNRHSLCTMGTFLRDIEAEDFEVAIIIRFKNGAIGIIEGTAYVYPKI